MGNEEEISTDEEVQDEEKNLTEQESGETGQENTTEEDGSRSKPGMTQETDQKSESGDDDSEEGESTAEDEEPEKPKKVRETRLMRLKRQKAELRADNERLRERVEAAEDRKKELTEETPLAPEDFESDLEYDKAVMAQQIRTEMASAEAEQRQADMQRIQTQEQETAENAFKERSIEFAKMVPDYEKTVHRPDIAIPPVAVEALLESEMGPALLYELAKNPAQAEELFNLSPVQAMMEIGKMEARLMAGGATRKTPKRAPEPINPVGASGGDVTSKELKDLNTDEYIAHRRKQMGVDG